MWFEFVEVSVEDGWGNDGGGYVRNGDSVGEWV